MKPHYSEDKAELPLILSFAEKCGIRRDQEPITMGVPFPQGLVFDSTTLGLYSESDDSISLQWQVTARWKDQSIQWALLDFQVSVKPYGTTSYRLDNSENLSGYLQDSPLIFSQSSEQHVVKTGAASFFLNPRVFSPFARVVIDGKDALNEKRISSFSLTDAKGQKHEPTITSMIVESQGPVRLTLRFEGIFSNTEVSAFRFRARLSFFAGSAVVKLEFTLHNPQAADHPGGCWDLGDEGSLFFKDLSWHVALRESGQAFHGWNVDSDQPMMIEDSPNIEIYQDSSGGSNWNSPNHVNRFGEVKQRYSGYRVARDGVIVRKGKRATPTLFVTREGTSIVGTIQNFWQNFPKALELDNNVMYLRLFPNQFEDIYELQAGEQKTHTCVVAFTQSSNPEVVVNWIHAPLRTSISAAWYSGTKAVRYLSPRIDGQHSEYAKFIDTPIQEPHSWFSRREQIDEYGWRHFGEIYADHEAVQSPANVPFISHYNNQYDALHGLLIEYLRTGEERWFSLAQDLARHVIDIDIYHTQEDQPISNGGLFWHSGHYTEASTATHRTYSRLNKGKECSDSSFGGGPSNEHNYTTGLLYYYFLTGDLLAAEAVEGLADWVINLDDPQHSILGKIDGRPTGLASWTVELTYHGPGRGSGNSVNALIDAYALTKEGRFLHKAEELIQRCIHPLDDISRHNFEDIEHRWSYTMFLSVLGKYLDLKVAEEQVDYMYSYAREGFLHYATWMVDHEVPYLQLQDRVKIPTETWSAQDMRKSHVLNVAAKYAEKPLRDSCYKKAKFFYEACLNDLSTFKTSTLTRPVVLLMTNGYVQAYCERHPPESVPSPQQSYDFGLPKKFTPQGGELHRVRAFLSILQTSIKRCVASCRGGGPERHD